LVRIWSEILKIDENLISINDNFFHLGGNSLLSIILSNKISRKFNKKINATSIFKNPTIKKQELSLVYNEKIDYLDFMAHWVEKKEFSEEFKNMFIENDKHARKIVNEYTPTAVTTDSIYYHSNIKKQRHSKSQKRIKWV
jgi:acyl carrier protein